jgi:DNA repair exonuclease SbcCD ATPase subunit
VQQQNALAEKQRGELESEVKSLQALVDTLKTEMTLRDEAIEKREAVERQIVHTTMASPPVAVDLPDTEALVAAERERLQSVHELAIAELTDKLAATEQLVSKKAQIVKTLTSEVEMLKESMKHLMDIKQEAEQQRDASANDKLNSLAVMQEQLADAERATSEWSERVRSTDKMLEQAQLVAEEQRTLMFNYESQIELLKTEILNTTAAQQEHESGELRSLRQELNDKSKECEALTAQVVPVRYLICAYTCTL